MNFNPSKMDADIWMRDCGDHYEYIACYVDDLMIASRQPQTIIDALTKPPNNFKLKGTGPVTFHLGCNFFRYEDGTLCVGPRKYIDRMAMQYESMFGSKPWAQFLSPLMANDHPEMDMSELLDEDGIHQYQSLIGVLQWTISLGRFDVATTVMTMSGFRVAPWIGHLVRATQTDMWVPMQDEARIHTNQNGSSRLFGPAASALRLGTNSLRQRQGGSSLRCTQTTWETCDPHLIIICRCQPVSRHVHRAICFGSTTLHQPNSHRMVFQETANRRNSYVWVRVRGSKDGSAANHRHTHGTTIPRGGNSRSYPIVW
jgi:hypothetical protein